MSGDTIIFIAFCLFILLLGSRFRQRISESKGGRPEMKRRVRFFSIIQLVVLGGLMIYMVPLLIRDFSGPGQAPVTSVILRCLIFVFTIYIFVTGCMRLCGRKDQENAEE